MIDSMAPFYGLKTLFLDSLFLTWDNFQTSKLTQATERRLFIFLNLNVKLLQILYQHLILCDAEIILNFISFKIQVLKYLNETKWQLLLNCKHFTTGDSYLVSHNWTKLPVHVETSYFNNTAFVSRQEGNSGENDVENA